ESLRSSITEQLGEFGPDRIHCQKACLEAVHDAFSDYRSSQLEGFQGEKALICTCFGISEDTIDSVIRLNPIVSVEQVGQICNAGTGCGSCRMLIQEMIDQNKGLADLAD
ncbi:MAG: (2Fe-2S)-binding protein, partial [Pyrinomonadaceae bacterium]